MQIIIVVLITLSLINLQNYVAKRAYIKATAKRITFNILRLDMEFLMLFDAQTYYNREFMQNALPKLFPDNAKQILAYYDRYADALSIKQYFERNKDLEHASRPPKFNTERAHKLFEDEVSRQVIVNTARKYYQKAKTLYNSRYKEQ